MSRKGFTLIELLIATTILVIVIAIVYASFVSVTSSVEEARIDAQKMKLRQFLIDNLHANIATIYTDFRSLAEDSERDPYLFAFQGIDEEASKGPADSLQFACTAPLMGGLALPGDLKLVRYEVSSSQSEEAEAEMDPGAGQEEDEADERKLRVTETPVIASNLQTAQDDQGMMQSQTAEKLFEAAEGFESPSWSVPVRSFDVAYFDGDQWMDEWDSVAVGRLPWALRVRVNFAKTDEEVAAENQEGLDQEENPDFELVLSIPGGAGTVLDARDVAYFFPPIPEEVQNVQQAGQQNLQRQQRNQRPGVRQGVQRRPLIERRIEAVAQ
jgi:prepilin-type N-terminal cleavage/methylation domain-containing protein